MLCVKCKKEIDDGDLYCGYCGINQSKFSKYLEKVSDSIHKEKDKEYDNNVKEAQKKLNDLKSAKVNEINRILKERWKSIGNNFSYNVTEGKLLVNGSQYIFSDIKGC